MDTRMLILLLVTCIAGSLAYPSEWGPEERASAITEDGVLTRVHRATADANTKSKDSNSSTPARTVAPSTTAVPTAARSEPKTSSTPKSTEQTPASSTSAPASAPTSAPIASPVGDNGESSTSKPKDEASPSDTASSSPSGSSSPSQAPPSYSRSNFDDDGEKAPTDNAGSPSVFLPPQNAINPAPNVNGWGQTGANGWAGASAGSFAGAGSFGYPGPLGPSGTNFHGRTPFANPSPSYPTNNNYGGNGYYDGNSMNQPMFYADPLAFQRMMDEHFRNLQAQFEAQQRAFWEATNSVNGVPYSMNSFPSGPSTAPGGPQNAYAGISLGPRGGFQTGYINPVAPGVESRFGEDIPAPSGNSYGVYASSVSSSSTGPDGKQVSHKKSTTVVNDNGKISSRTIED